MPEMIGAVMNRAEGDCSPAALRHSPAGRIRTGINGQVNDDGP
jgi:hypothetical protein